MTAGELLGACLGAAGVTRVFAAGAGPGIAGVEVVDAVDPAAALLMAAADGRLGGGAGVACVGRGELWFTAAAGSPPDVSIHVDGAGRLPEAVASASGQAAAPMPATVRVRLDMDLGGDAPAAALPVAPAAEDDRAEVADAVAAAVAAAERPVVLAGPGVAHGPASMAQVAGLHAVAAAGSVGVLNTWGVKGVFDWRSRHHLATAGLQERDFELAGFADADLIVATGVDAVEAPPAAWQLAPWVDVAPAALADLSERWSRPALPIEAVALRTVLGDAVAGWWESQSSPVAPARAVAGMAAALGPRGLVAADPGDAGLWVARSYATTRLGSVSVPARGGTEGWAAACTFAAMLRDPSRRTLAVVDHLDSLTAGIVDLARRRGLPLVVVVWDRDAAPTSPEEHDARIGRALAERRPAVLRVGVDRSHTDDLVDIAGRVVAWT